MLRNLKIADAASATANKLADAAGLAVNEEDVIDIGVDGSLVEFYPGFEHYIREALRAMDGIGAAGERRIRIGIAKDGSGVGAALIALVAAKMEKTTATGLCWRFKEYFGCCEGRDCNVRVMDVCLDIRMIYD
ncbi:hypothetical protein DID88_005699 [Monilinia fructigena]|uniref:Phosphotransferase n=1 Tax=Monilinia fructigena TaxID=38457 RepID=A0A395J1P3_9HELO|nr:hypothetical protein DID88_005699 [Monilinia fructigena]